jgi:hypothetical protein
MKNILKTVIFLLVIFLFPGLAKAQGLENFNNYPETGNSYKDGTFSGQDGSTWTYKQSRGDSAIVAPSPTLGKKRNPTACITSGTLQGGCGTLQFDYKQPFTSTVNLNVYVNGLLVGNVTSTVQGQLINSGPLNVNVSGPFTLLLKQADSTNSGQVTIDNVSWTAFGGGNPDPEPSNYPTGFDATANGLSCGINFTDATGTQLPSGYIVFISESSTLPVPVDGTPTSDDYDLNDGVGAKNLSFGINTFTFQGLSEKTEYFLTVYPYTNFGSTIDYKTDVTAPTANIVTPEIIHFQNFENGMAGWTQFSVTGDQVWTADSIHGIDATVCFKMSGFANQVNNQNEDWLISAAIDASKFTEVRTQFYSAKNYAGDLLKVKISTDYSSGDPTTASWTDLSSSVILSAGSWAWTASGFFNPNADQTSSVHVAFVYTSSATDGSTWEVDNVLLTGNKQVGINEQTQSFAANLYPNPCKDRFNLTLPDKDTYHVTIYSELGTVFMSKEVNAQLSQITVNHLSSGTYWVNIRNTSTGKSLVKALTIQK